MPAWLIKIVVGLAVKYGMGWLMKRFPWIPDDVKAIIEQLVGELQKHQTAKVCMINDAQAKIAECYNAK